MKKFCRVMFVAAGLAGAVGAATNSSVWASQGSSGRMIRRPDALGNRVLDYSGVGYKGGTVPIPVVAVKTNISPVAGDNGPNIQAAIDYVATLPLTNGFRGAVFLSAGEYPISNSITIRASGIVLRGAGAGTNGAGTILRAAGPRPTASETNTVALIYISGIDNDAVSGTARSITNTYVPVGALSFNVNSTNGLTVGSRVLITRASPTNWITDIGMDQVSPAWTAGGFDVKSERFITCIEDNRVMIDTPLTCAIESQYGGAKIQPYAWSGRISNVGIEDIFGVSDFDPAVTSTVGSTPAYYADERHAWIFIKATSVEDAWVRRVTVKSFAYSCVTMGLGTRNMTVCDSTSLDPVSIITGSRRYAFSLQDAQNCLVKNCYTRKDRHQFVTDSLDTGPNVFVDGLSDTAYNDAGPHFRWGTGAIWDNVTVNGNNLDVQNRGNMGTSHGWAGANEVVWNSKAGGFIVQNPPTARNWLIGSVGTIQAGTGYVGPHDPGTYDSHGTNVFPNSLYYAQLQDRLAVPNRETREYWLGVIDGFTGNSDVVALDSAWSNAVQSIASGQPLDPFNVVTNNHWIPFTFNYSLGATDQVVAATLSLSLRAVGSATNDMIYLGSTNNSFTFSSLGWLPIGTGTNTTARVLDLSSQLNLLTNGILNVAVAGDAGIDWAMLELQVAPVQTVYTNSILPEADAYVRAGASAGLNFGTGNTLDIRADTSANNQRQGYLRWDLTGRATNILQARIRLMPTSVSTNGYEHGIALVTNSNWSESTVNWTNQPGGGKRFATWIPAANVPVEFVVTPQVQAALNDDGKLSLELFSVTNAGSGMVSYAAREYASFASYRPQLLLIYSGIAPNHSAPSVSLTSPADGASFATPASITLTADASSATGTITTVSFYNGTTLLGSGTNAPYAYTWMNVAAGAYNLTARAIDNSGAVSTSAVVAATVTNSAVTYTNTYTATDTWICPSNVFSVQVECWGGGGAGGGASRNSQISSVACGGGGAGGAYARYNYYPVTSGKTYYINTGAGGVSVMTDTAKVSGGDSWFNTNNFPSTVVIAKGGSGGETVLLQNNSTRYGEGGAGTTNGSAGDVVYAGGSGVTPASNAAGGGGGGSGGTNSAGNNAYTVNVTNEFGAVAVPGGGPGGNGNTAGSSGSGKTPTSPPGGGGGGARCGNQTTTFTGGSGAGGQVILTYTVDPAATLTAGFSASPANGGAPLTVTFTDTSTGPITNRYWNFGDSVTTNITTTSLIHTYSFPGTSTVSLIVSGASGSSTNTQTNLIVATSVDTVGDGAPDWWRAQYFGGNGTTTNTDSSASADFDQDGLNNLAEYLADTNPTNAASRLAITGFAIVTNQIRLIWTGGSSVWQTVEYRASLMDTNGWKAVYTNTPPTAVTNTLFDTGAGTATSRFYRIKAWR
jgi:PKD repeat protein